MEVTLFTISPILTMVFFLVARLMLAEHGEGKQGRTAFPGLAEFAAIDFLSLTRAIEGNRGSIPIATSIRQTI
jgi:hypothetical protein